MGSRRNGCIDNHSIPLHFVSDKIRGDNNGEMEIQ